MEYRILGRTGLKVGAIALGCEGFADKTAEEVRADFDFAIRNGINFLDLYASNPELRAVAGKGHCCVLLPLPCPDSLLCGLPYCPCCTARPPRPGACRTQQELAERSGRHGCGVSWYLFNLVYI